RRLRLVLRLDLALALARPALDRGVLRRGRDRPATVALCGMRLALGLAAPPVRAFGADLVPARRALAAPPVSIRLDVRVLGFLRDAGLCGSRRSGGGRVPLGADRRW